MNQSDTLFSLATKNWVWAITACLTLVGVGNQLLTRSDLFAKRSEPRQSAATQMRPTNTTQAPERPPRFDTIDSVPANPPNSGGQVLGSLEREDLIRIAAALDVESSRLKDLYVDKKFPPLISEVDHDNPDSNVSIQFQQKDIKSLYAAGRCWLFNFSIQTAASEEGIVTAALGFAGHSKGRGREHLDGLTLSFRYGTDVTYGLRSHQFRAGPEENRVYFLWDLSRDPTPVADIYPFVVLRAPRTPTEPVWMVGLSSNLTWDRIPVSSLVRKPTASESMNRSPALDELDDPNKILLLNDFCDTEGP